MAKTVGFKDYVKSAFHAKPWGMPISPNWIMLAAFGMSGVLLNPGFLIIGAGCELGYLFLLSTNRRFQNYIRAVHISKDQAGKVAQLSSLIEKLWPDARKRFFRLQERCETILEFYTQFLNVGTEIAQQHGHSLNKFMWIFLQLLLTKQAISKVMKDRSYMDHLSDELDDLEKQMQDPNITAELKKSMEGKQDIIKQRLDTLKQAENKLKYIDAELDRIEQQVELIREQAVISKDSQAIATRIDLVTTSLGETTDWIKDQQNVFGAVQDLVEEPPPILSQPSTQRQ